MFISIIRHGQSEIPEDDSWDFLSVKVYVQDHALNQNLS